MKSIKKRWTTLALCFTMFFLVGILNTKFVMASDDFTIESSSVKNGSVIISFDTLTSPTINDFSIPYTINGESISKLSIRSISSLDYTGKRFQINFDPILATNVQQNINFYLNYKPGSYSTEKIFKLVLPASIEESIKILSSTNGSMIIEFDTAKTDITLNDFTANLRIDGENKGNIPLSRVLYVPGYNKRFELYYEKIQTTNYYQKIDIDIRYKNGIAKTSSYTLYASGNTSDSNDEKDANFDYSNREAAPFYIKDLKNGEVLIRFKNELKSNPKLQDFSAECYIDGKYNSMLKFEDVDEDSVRYTTDFTLYFQELEATNKVQNVVIVLFYKYNYQPVKESFDLLASDIQGDLDITIKEVKEFKSKLVIPTITIKEQSKNSLLESTKSNTEYIRLEAPAGFVWSKKAYISGKDGFQGAAEYDIRYDTIKKEQQSNILLLGLLGLPSNRSKAGILYLDDLELTSTSDSSFGDVNIRISGAGIPYERITIGKYVSSQVEKPIDVPTPTPVPQKTKFEVQVTNNYPQMNVNGTLVSIDAPPYLVDGRMMLPVSHITSAFGISSKDVIWNGINRTVTIIDNHNTIMLTIGSKIMQINGTPVIMDTPAVIVNERTFIPISFLGNALGFVSSWDDITKTATLTTER